MTVLATLQRRDGSWGYLTWDDGKERADVVVCSLPYTAARLVGCRGMKSDRVHPHVLSRRQRMAWLTFRRRREARQKKVRYLIYAAY